MTNPSSTSPTTSPTTIEPSDLPVVVRDFLQAHAARDVDAAARAFTGDAVVTDQGDTFRGTQEIVRFLRESGSEFTYTSELVAAEHTGGQQWVAVVRIEGDFPGGLADLSYRFTLSRDLVSELHIGT